MKTYTNGTKIEVLPCSEGKHCSGWLHLEHIRYNIEHSNLISCCTHYHAVIRLTFSLLFLMEHLWICYSFGEKIFRGSVSFSLSDVVKRLRPNTYVNSNKINGVRRIVLSFPLFQNSHVGLHDHVYVSTYCTLQYNCHCMISFLHFVLF